MIDCFAETSQLLDGIYPYVPVALVRDLIAKHGGAVSGTAPEGVLVLKAIE